MSSNNEKGYFESAVDKTKEMAHGAKEKISETYDKVTGNRVEDKAARNVKEGADKAADKAGDLRDKAADKMREGARKLEH